MKIKKTCFILFLALAAYSSAIAQSGINIKNPDPYTSLDIFTKSGAKSGVLIPRVELVTSTDDLNTDGDGNISNQPKGLLIYNPDGVSGGLPQGFYYWNGNEWRIIASNTSIQPGVNAIMCSEATLSPASYVSGQAYNGTLTVPYIGGNGGSYGPGSPIASTGVTGLNATLQAGSLAYGNGYLTYTITGTPNASSPATASFIIPSMFGGAGCTVTVGAGRAFNIGEAITAIYSVPAGTAGNSAFNLGTYVTANNLTPLPKVDGLEINLQGNSAAFYDPRIYNRASSSQLISYQSFATSVNENETSLNNTVAANGFVQVDANDIVQWTTSAAEVETTNVQVQINATTYRWYEFKWWCMEVAGAKKIFISVMRKA